MLIIPVFSFDIDTVVSFRFHLSRHNNINASTYIRMQLLIISHFSQPPSDKPGINKKQISQAHVSLDEVRVTG